MGNLMATVPSAPTQWEEIRTVALQRTTAALGGNVMYRHEPTQGVSYWSCLQWLNLTLYIIYIYYGHVHLHLSAYNQLASSIYIWQANQISGNNIRLISKVNANKRESMSLGSC